MIKYLIFVCFACVLLLASCNENSNSSVDYANGLNCNFTGNETFKFSSSTATAVTSTVGNSKTLLISGKMQYNGKDVTLSITVFGSAVGTYELNFNDQKSACLVNFQDGESFTSQSGKVTITSIGTTLGAKAKGTFNFTLIDSKLDKQLILTAGTFNLFHTVY